MRHALGMIMFDEGRSRFNYRVGACCIRDAHILLNTAPDIDFWWIPGGRVDMQEPAIDALRREMREELGITVTVGRLLWVVENFFTLQGKDFHELALLFEMQLPDECAFLDLTRTYEREDTGVSLLYRWVPLLDLTEVNLQPTFLHQALLTLPASTQHIINHDNDDRVASHGESI